MQHTPLTKQRSPWINVEELQIDGIDEATYERRVHDGTLFAIVGEEPQGWHLSISFRDQRGRLSRYPTWDEIVHARDALLPADVEFAMFLPAAGDYVALHDTTFHLHEYPEREQ